MAGPGLSRCTFAETPARPLSWKSSAILNVCRVRFSGPSWKNSNPNTQKRLVVVFREHPLKMHRFARDAARAAEAAGLQGRFWEMHDMLYRNRDTWVPGPYIGPSLNDYAAQLHLDVDRFKADMDGDEVTKRLAADWDRGESLGIDRTPVLFLNGAKVAVNARDEKALREAIDETAGRDSATDAMTDMQREKLRKRLYAVASAIALFGLADGIYLTVEHVTGRTAECIASSGCQDVLSSKYATVGQLPLAALGAFAYFTAFSAALLAAFEL
jgi:Protein-disulfide isomerase